MSSPYRVCDYLGGGAFATAVVVELPDGDRRALKVLRPGREGEVDAVSRFRDESHILELMRHPNIVEGYGLRRFGDSHLAMELEFVDGVPLDRIFENGLRKMSPLQATELVAQVADALWCGYATIGPSGPLRIVHRDIRPGNLMLDRTGTIKVLDFGLARGDFEEREAVSLYDVGGSPGFIAPERKDGDSSGPEVDVYSLGVLLVLLITGQQMLLPHSPERHQEVAGEHVRQLPLDGAEHVRELVARMLSHDPTARPGMQEVLTVLQEHPPEGGLRLADMADDWVAGVKATRRRVKWREHHRFREISFVERMTPQAESTEPVDVARRKLTLMLGDAGWVKNSARVAELRRASDPPIDGPLLDRLDRVDPPWWRVFARATTVLEAETLLHILGDRPSLAAVERAQRLLKHGDERVRKAAQLVVDRRRK